MFKLGFSVIPVSLLCSVVWQVIVACHCAFPVGWVSSLLISSSSLKFIWASHQFSAFSFNLIMAAHILFSNFCFWIRWLQKGRCIHPLKLAPASMMLSWCPKCFILIMWLFSSRCYILVKSFHLWLCIWDLECWVLDSCLSCVWVSD